MKFPKTGLPFDFPTFAVFKIVQPEVEVHGDQGSLARQESEKKNNRGLIVRIYQSWVMITAFTSFAVGSEAAKLPM